MASGNISPQDGDYRTCRSRKKRSAMVALAVSRRTDTRRRRASRCCGTPAILIQDVERFYEIDAAADGRSDAARLERDYLAPGSASRSAKKFVPTDESHASRTSDNILVHICERMIAAYLMGNRYGSDFVSVPPPERTTAPVSGPKHSEVAGLVHGAQPERHTLPRGLNSPPAVSSSWHAPTP